ncbi:hypothetical protein CEXT_295901 [Caerostris extrusa]|uniref:Uncharacterized protein n=1 Tax=Caerostris extrusa TaxID=172846 RepID=A0AAV4UNQ2_CAEEX|nr:hypothetical protein CEXT_295901 [Caerostris extrusa]
MIFKGAWEEAYGNVIRARDFDQLVDGLGLWEYVARQHGVRGRKMEASSEPEILVSWVMDEDYGICRRAAWGAWEEAYGERHQSQRFWSVG